MYLYHFGLTKLPFSLTPDTDLFCALTTHQEALNTLFFALKSGEAFCKITGEVGSGKTMICRVLLNQLSKQRQVAYLPNPVLTPRELKLALAHELKMRITSTIGEEQLVPKIQQRLAKEVKKTGPVILVIDEAQSMPDETLEALRLFTNLETEQFKLLQIVMLGQPELDDKLSRPNLRQLRQRISFSYRLKTLSFDDSKRYLMHRLRSVDGTDKISFSWPAILCTHYFSRGIPRLLNVLGHKALLVAYGKGKHRISASFLWSAAKDTEDTKGTFNRLRALLILGAVSLASSTAAAWWVWP